MDGIKCDRKKSRVQQHLKNDCDVNQIVAKARRAMGQTPEYPQVPRGAFTDCTLMPKDFAEYNERILAVNEAFNSLPSPVRERFRNDPFEILGFIENPANYDEAVRLGLIDKKEPSQPKEGEETKQKV